MRKLRQSDIRIISNRRQCKIFFSCAISFFMSTFYSLANVSRLHEQKPLASSNFFKKLQNFCLFSLDSENSTVTADFFLENFNRLFTPLYKLPVIQLIATSQYYVFLCFFNSFRILIPKIFEPSCSHISILISLKLFTTNPYISCFSQKIFLLLKIFFQHQTYSENFFTPIIHPFSYRYPPLS